MKRTTALLSFVLVATSAVASPPANRSGRAHYRVASAADKSIVYDVTRITQFKPRSTEITFLVTDYVSKRRYILENRRDFEAQTVTLEIRDVTTTGKPHLVRSVMKLPLRPDSEAGTHSQLAALAKSKGVRAVEAEIPVSVEVSSRKDHSVRDRAAGWANATTGKAYREDVRSALDPSFLASIDKLQQELFQLPQFIDFCADLGRYVASKPCRPNPAFTVALTGNTCTEDARFGYPCQGTSK